MDWRLSFHNKGAPDHGSIFRGQERLFQLCLEVLGDVFVGGKSGHGAVGRSGDHLAEGRFAHVARGEEAGDAGLHVGVDLDPTALSGLDQILDKLDAALRRDRRLDAVLKGTNISLNN